MDTGPAHFYRYRSVREEAALHVERTVCHNELYFPAAVSFNDPFDCRPTFSSAASPDELKQKVKRLSEDRAWPALDRNQRRFWVRSLRDSKVLAKIQTDNITEITSAMGVLCLSEIADDILMWSHYADSHRGLCLEFDGSAEFFARAQQVVYKTERPIINPFLDSQERSVRDKWVIDALLTKAAHWCYEKEWRIVEYASRPQVYHFPPTALTGIIIGANMPDTSAAVVASWIRQRRTPVKLYRALVDPMRYALRIDAI